MSAIRTIDDALTARHGELGRAREVADVARRGRARVLVTNVFGATSDVALGALREAGASVRVPSLRECSSRRSRTGARDVRGRERPARASRSCVLNPGGSTYHPKVFLGRSGDRVAAMVGSSNLTSGLVANVEAATLLRGTAGEHPIASLWTWGESLWADPRVLD